MSAVANISATVKSATPFTSTWSKVSGPGTVTFGNASSLSTTATFGSAGTYVLRITVDNGEFEETDDITVIAAANAAPVVSAGADFSVLENVNANISGSYTDDGFPSGGTVTTTWSKVSGSGTATFGDANDLSTTVSFSAADTYVIRLTVSDGTLSGTDDITVTVTSSLGTKRARATSQAVPGGASLTADGTVFLIDMSRFHANWWSAVDAAGATIRVCLGGTTTQIPYDLIRFSKAGSTGFLAIKTQAVSGGTQIDVWCGNSDNTAYSVGDTYGQYNVYRTNILGFWPSGGGNDRTRNANNMTTEGSPVVANGPIGAQATQYSSTSRSKVLLSAAVPLPVSLFSATNTTSANGNLWFHTIGLARTASGTINSWNNMVYQTGASTTPTFFSAATIDGSGNWASSFTEGSSQTYKAFGSIFTSTSSRTSVSSVDSDSNTVTRAVTGMDIVVIGHPSILLLSSAPAYPNVSLAMVFKEAVNANEFAYMDLMLDQATFWGVWADGP